jgi:uncharacterized protein (TIGR03435 family)
MDSKRLTVNSPLIFSVCLSRVTSADLRKRIVDIMTDRVMRKLRFSRVMLLVVAGSMAVVAPSLLGQGSVAPRGAVLPATVDVKVPPFDVVSVKLNKSDSGMMRIMIKPDGYSATNVSLMMLIEGAFGIREDQISGVPSWGDSARYDVDAKVAGADVDTLKKLSPKQRRAMLQPVLADRFKLKAHTEIKQLPVYELVIAKSGSKLKESTPGDVPVNGIKGPDGVVHGGMMSMGPGKLTGQELPIASLTDMLSQQLEHTVIDKTGLAGKYDFTLQWAEESSDQMLNGADGGQQRAEPAPDASGPSIFTALQEQLGLRLQSTKGPVETLVVDHVEMPSEN